jgi:hypothetical protein
MNDKLWFWVIIMAIVCGLLIFGSGELTHYFLWGKWLFF